LFYVSFFGLDLGPGTAGLDNKNDRRSEFTASSIDSCATGLKGSHAEKRTRGQAARENRFSLMHLRRFLQSRRTIYKPWRLAQSQWLLQPNAYRPYPYSAFEAVVRSQQSLIIVSANELGRRRHGKTWQKV